MFLAAWHSPIFTLLLAFFYSQVSFELLNSPLCSAATCWLCPFTVLALIRLLLPDAAENNTLNTATPSQKPSGCQLQKQNNELKDTVMLNRVERSCRVSLWFNKKITRIARQSQKTVHKRFYSSVNLQNISTLPFKGKAGVDFFSNGWYQRLIQPIMIHSF